MAVRSYIRGTTGLQNEAQQDVGKFIETVDQLTQWEDRHDAKDSVKTVSRMVQSFERTAIRSVTGIVSASPYTIYRDSVQTAFALDRHEEGDGTADTVGSCQIESTACWLRRNDQLFDLFAAAVANEIIWADATNGTRSIAMHLCERLLNKKNEALVNIARTIHAQAAVFQRDEVGMPLMEMNGSMCVARGVLVVCPGSQSATYVLDVEQPHGADPAAPLDLTNVRNITITHVMNDSLP
jgi:hypothetical protein